MMGRSPKPWFSSIIFRVLETLLQTKLHIPPLRPHLVHRPHLLERLNQGLSLEHKLSLVSAPAGFGKTTLLSAWVDTLDHPVVWLSLDAADDDPCRFFAYLLAALQKIEANLGQEIVGVIRAGQLPPAEIISAALVNGILALSDRFLLIIDDVHLIEDRFILQVLDQLVTNLPPQLHLVLSTREDPPLSLARLRANNQLTEIRARELRFTSHDIALFLHQALDLSLSETDVAILENKTEGWIAGLQLAALSMRDRSNPSRLIASLSGSHRFILSYLTEQVLDRQSQEIRQFLLQTAILDRLNGALCNAVTGRSDGRAMLERLFNANLFLIPLDDEGQWYRYHRLFADLLRDRRTALQEKETALLHQRASRWFAQEGITHEAIRHALAAADYQMAVELLESHALSLIMQGYVKTVYGWMDAIPEQWQSQSPRTNLAFAWLHLLRGTYAQASPHLARLEGTFSDSQVSHGERQSLRAEWLVMRSLLLNREGKTTESLTLAEEALTSAPEQNSRVLSMAYFGLANAYRVMKSDELAMDAYQVSVQYSRTADNLVAEMLSVSGLAAMALENGQLHLAKEIADPVSERLNQANILPPIGAVIYGILGEVYYHWGRIRRARKYARRALHLSTLGGYRSGMIGCRVLLSRLFQLAGQLAPATLAIQEAMELLQLDTPDYVRQEAIAQQVCAHLAGSRPAAAQMALQGQGFSFRDQFDFPKLLPGKNFSHASGLLYNSSLRFLLYQARVSDDLIGLEQGMVLADQIVARAQKGHYLIVALDGLLLRAQMHAKLGDDRASQIDYLSALQLGEPEGFIGIFVEQGLPVIEALGKLIRLSQPRKVQPQYVERIVNAFRDSHPANSAKTEPGLTDATPPSAPIEPLTDRETEILRLIARGLKYQEIADKLFISLNTVRFHVKAIYGKLSVNNRTQAVQTARQLQIL
jgi:LuxR family maltose regulon positive regulatory protein